MTKPRGTRPGKTPGAAAADDVAVKDANETRPPSEQLATMDQLCGAKTQTKHGYCRLTAGYRTDHPGYGNCANHGGDTDAGQKFAAKLKGRELLARYKSDYQRFGGDRTAADIALLTPELVLLEEVRRSAAMVRFLEERIASWGLNEIQLATVETFVETSGHHRKPDEVKEFLESLDSDNPDSSYHLPELMTVNDNTGISAFTNQREWLTLYREERLHMVRTAKMAIDAGVAQRLVSLAEDQGRILSTALRVVLSALSLTSEQQALVPIVVPRVLRAVASDQPVPDISSLLETAS